jgi:hypothetical protein
MAGQEGNGRFFRFSSNGNGKNNGNGGGNDNYSFEPDDDAGEEEHEHEYANIAQTPNLSAYEELVHQVITLEFHDRGLSLDFSYEEAEELGQVLADIVSYLSRKRTYEP